MSQRSQFETQNVARDGAQGSDGQVTNGTPQNGSSANGATGASIPTTSSSPTAPSKAAEPTITLPKKGSGTKEPKKRNLKPILLGVGIPVALLVLIYGYNRYKWGQWHISTDDAYVTSDVVQITPQIAGQIERIAVTDNQHVQKGDLLATLDDASYRADLTGAQANLAVAQAAESSALANVQLVQRTGNAQIQQAVGGVTQAQGGEGAAQSGITQAQANVQNAQAAVNSAQDNARVAQTQIATAQATRNQANQTARAQQALITVAQARQRSAQAGIRTAQANVTAAQAGRARAEQTVKSARAQFVVAQAGVSAAQAGIRTAQANITAAEAAALRAQRDYERQQTLFQGGAAPRANVDTAEATQVQAQSAVTGAKAALDTANEQLRQAQQNVTARQTDVASAQEGVRAAEAQIAASQAAVAQARQGVAEAGANIGNSRAQAAAAQEAIAQANTGIVTNQARYSAALAAVRQAQSNVAAQQALQGGAVQNLGVARGKTATAQGQLASAQTAPNQLAVAQANYKSAHSRTLQAQAAVRTAELNLQRTQLRAPVEGTVSSRTGQLGQQVAVGQALMSILPKNDVWVVANFKETQLGEVEANQKVEIEVDGLPQYTFKGHVNTLAAGTGATFALLPPENASGNFTKVVQRIPVKITFDPNQRGLDRLRAGMSALPTIATKSE